jgi:hypothetical protein
VNAIGPAYAKYANALQENGITGGLVEDMSIAEIEEVYHRPYEKALDSLDQRSKQKFNFKARCQ